MSEQDLNFVLNLDALAGSVRMCSDSTRELHPVADLLPWPLKFTLVSKNHKHAFENRGPPSRKMFLERLANLEQKIKWRAALGGQSHDQVTWGRHKMYHIKKLTCTVMPALRGLMGPFAVL